MERVRAFFIHATCGLRLAKNGLCRRGVVGLVNPIFLDKKEVYVGLSIKPTIVREIFMNNEIDVLLEEKKENLMLEIANLELDAKIGKDRHFIASDRKNLYRIYLGLISVIGTAVIASQAIRDFFNAIKIITPHQTLAISLISLIVGVSTAILGFLGLEKQVAHHRFVGNLYIEVARKASRLMYDLATISGENDLNRVRKKFAKLLNKYLEINKEGESCPTSNKDSKKAFSQNKEGKEKLKPAIRNKKATFLNLNSVDKK